MTEQKSCKIEGLLVLGGRDVCSPLERLLLNAL